MPVLVPGRGLERMARFRVSGGRATVGRGDTVDLLLPDDGVSRTHCMIVQRQGAWWVVDRSKHGTRVQGRAVKGEVRLAHGDVLGVGPFELEFLLEEGAPGPTATGWRTAATPEVLVGAGPEAAVDVVRCVLQVVEGPATGRAFPLDHTRVNVGGPGNEVDLGDPAVVAEHLLLAVNRGRVIAIPRAGATWVDGERVVDALALRDEDLVQVGSSVFRVVQQEVRLEERTLSFGEMVGASPAMTALFGMLRRMARHTPPVLLYGESGTGKELAAAGLHAEGPRAAGPYVALNCAAVTPTLFESELFGHEKGSFTGATERRDGAFHRAHGGTLFLDEVGELPLEAQAKLLRTLETGEVRRVGGRDVTYPDVRLVSATNRDLERAVAEGRFRADLYFRLAVLAVRLPPLRERPEDLPALVDALAARLDPAVHVTPEARRLLAAHTWPGNVRELRNVLTRAYVLEGPTIEARSLRFTPFPTDEAPPVMELVSEAERSLLDESWTRHHGNTAAMARELGLARSTLRYKLKRHGIL